MFQYCVVKTCQDQFDSLDCDCGLVVASGGKGKATDQTVDGGAASVLNQLGLTRLESKLDRTGPIDGVVGPVPGENRLRPEKSGEQGVVTRRRHLWVLLGWFQYD